MYMQKLLHGKGLAGMNGKSLVLSTGQGARGTKLKGFEYCSPSLFLFALRDMFETFE